MKEKKEEECGVPGLVLVEKPEDVKLHLSFFSGFSASLQDIPRYVRIILFEDNCWPPWIRVWDDRISIMA